jgi:CubicO group peptidase (beta-lactamase class C family)
MKNPSMKSGRAAAKKAGRRLFRLALACFSLLLLPLGTLAADEADALGPRIDALFLREMKAAGIPCAAVAITKDGELVYAQGYGEARRGVKAGADTPFYIGSVTKSMSALGLMILVEEGKVDLEAPVTAYLPFFRMADPRFAGIKVSDLLRQCSGLSTLQGMSYLGDPARVTMRDLIARLGPRKLASAPGTRYAYSNYNYVLVGAIIEEVSGLPYARFMEERVFAPLGMAMTSASRGTSERNGLAEGSRGFFSWTLRGQVGYPEGAVPEGYVASSARDMGAYLAFMQRHGTSPDGGRILSAEGIARMTSAQAAGAPYGYGWAITPRGYYHAGEDAGFVSLVFTIGSYPGWGCAILLGKSDSTAETAGLSLTRGFEIGIGGILGLPEAPPPPPAPWGRYRLLAGFAAALILCAMALSILALARRGRAKEEGRPSGKWKRRASAGAAVLLHLALPLAILLFPLWAGIPWSTMLAFSPDFPPLLLAFAILELLLGAARLATAGKRGMAGTHS